MLFFRFDTGGKKLSVSWLLIFICLFLTQMACKADVWNIEYLHSAFPVAFQKTGAEGVCEFE